MAKQYTLKGVISMIDQGATATMQRIEKSTDRLRTSASRVSKGFTQFNQGLAVAGAGGALLGAGFTKAISTASEFEAQITRVKSLSQGTAEELNQLELVAKQLGASTEFSATQAAQGLEFLALAGFKASDQIQVLPTILDAATAGAMDLGRASDVITDSMSALGKAFGENETKVQRATRLADMMALAQARSNTNIEQLGEAVKYGGGTLANFGVPLEQIIASMGKLADAGLKGSIGGTSLVNMFNKLTKPSKKGAELLDKFGLSIDTLPLNDVPKLIEVLSKGLGRFKNNNERAAAATELFGLRGIKAYNALVNGGTDAFRVLDTQLQNSQGFAKKVADEQRATFLGQTKAFKSAVEGILIELGNFFIKNKDHVLSTLGGIVSYLQDAGKAFQYVNGSVTIFGKNMSDITPRQKMLVEFVQGFKEGINEAFGAARQAFGYISDALKSVLPDGEGGIKTIGKMIAKFALLASIAAPVILGFVAMSFAATQLVTGFMGVFNIVRGLAGFLIGPLSSALTFLVMNPIGWVILGITALVAAGWMLWNNWDKVTQFFKDAWVATSSFLTDNFGRFGGFIVNAFTAVGDQLVNTWEFVSNTFTNVIKFWKSVFTGNWEAAGESFVNVFLGMGKFLFQTMMNWGKFATNIAASISAALIDGFKTAWNFITNLDFKSVLHTIFIKPFSFMWDTLKGIVKWTKGAGGEFLSGVGKGISSFFNDVPAAPEGKIIPPTRGNLDNVRNINEARQEKSRLSQSESSQQPVSVNVNQPPIEATFNISTQLDGREISKSVAKHSISNSERLGQKINPKDRARLNTNGMFALGAG